jgi:hypothetical protein
MSEYLAFKDLGGGQGAWVIPLTFGRARIITGPIGQNWLLNSW